MDTRQKLDEYVEMQGWDKNKLIGWSEAADFAEWLVKNCNLQNGSTCAKLRKALETIRDAFYTDGETDKEKVDDLKAIAFNVIYEIDNNIEVD